MRKEKGLKDEPTTVYKSEKMSKNSRNNSSDSMSSMCSSGNSSGNNVTDSSFTSSKMNKNLKPSVSVTSFIAFVSNLSTDTHLHNIKC